MQLQPVDLRPNPIRRYARYLTDEQRATIDDARDALRGARLVHLNATATGGGVAEILHSLVPLLTSLGIDARWYVLPPDDAFFGVTKQIHNWLQGAPGAPDRRTEADLSRLPASDRAGGARAGCRPVGDPRPAAVAAAGAGAARRAGDLALPHRRIGAQSGGGRLAGALHQELRPVGLQHAAVRLWRSAGRTGSPSSCRRSTR